MNLPQPARSLMSIATLSTDAARRDLPVCLVVTGVGIFGMALGMDLLGFGASGLGVKQLLAAGGGLFLMMCGVTIDRFGGRFLGQWLRSSVLVRRNAGRFLVLVLQLYVVVLVIRQFDIENPIFYSKLMTIIFFGFVINYFLPLSFRLPFFLLLSFTGIQVVFGIKDGVWLVGLGLCLIALCHLPIRLSLRVAILVAAGAAIAFLRAGGLVVPWSTAIWPILGSMFMFRVIVYLYDISHGEEPFRLSRTLSYFFLLPNIVFPLFPVVDYKTFRRTYYDDEDYRIYQRGIQWMLRGVVHLLLYRFVYYYMSIPPSEVGNPGELARHLIANYMLYLHISGKFHLIVGLLHLFGFHLPVTHHNYFLASSFTDFWRRINIYWKDFMMKVFYYPVYFRLRKLGPTPALVLATIVVFSVTWAFHSYQWFWLRGSFLFSTVDVLFWGILGVLVVVNALYETKHGRKRTLGKTSWTIGVIIASALRTAGTFVVICILWSLWTSASLREWLALWDLRSWSLTRQQGYVLATVAAAVAFGVVYWYRTEIASSQHKEVSFAKVAISTTAVALLVLLIGKPAIFAHLGPVAREILPVVRTTGLNRRDAALMQRGYYEDLVEVQRFNSQLWEVYALKPPEWPKISETDASRETGDFLRYELSPLTAIEFHGAQLRTNRWGMRDGDYERKKPPGTYRVALLGASHEMGSGVRNEETFEAKLEQLLNDRVGESRHSRYEILNFAVAGYGPPQYLWVLEHKIPDFEADAVFYAAHLMDENFAINHLANILETGTENPYQYLREIIARAGIVDGDPKGVVEKKLLPFGSQLISWLYKRIAERSREHGAVPVWVFVPSPGRDNPSVDAIARLENIAREAGFLTLSLDGVFDHLELDSIIVAPWDWHPNNEGHTLLARRLFEELLNIESELSLVRSSR